MGSTEDSDYVCSLDKASVKKAKDELGETPEDRLAAVQALREWIRAQPHIRFDKPDAVTLLRYLRHAKYSQLRAREMIEAFLTVKIQAPKWFKDLNVLDPKVKELIDVGYIIPLPKHNPDGSRTILYRLGDLKPRMVVMDGIIMANNIVLHYLGRSEMVQVNGISMIIDYTGYESKTIMKFLHPDLGKWFKIFQKIMPGRYKQFNHYNAGMFFETVMTFLRPFMKKKMIDRTVLHETAESLYKNIPKDRLPVEYLPDDYDGPNAGSVADILENFKKDIYSDSFRQELLYVTSDAFSVDSKKKPVEKVTEHFRKLAVD